MQRGSVDFDFLLNKRIILFSQDKTAHDRCTSENGQRKRRIRALRYVRPEVGLQLPASRRRHGDIRFIGFDTHKQSVTIAQLLYLVVTPGTKQAALLRLNDWQQSAWKYIIDIGRDGHD